MRQGSMYVLLFHLRYWVYGLGSEGLKSKVGLLTFDFTDLRLKVTLISPIAQLVRALH